jgi:hypothetical protein
VASVREADLLAVVRHLQRLIQGLQAQQPEGVQALAREYELHVDRLERQACQLREDNHTLVLRMAQLELALTHLHGSPQGERSCHHCGLQE